MTYCLGIITKFGLVMASDSRTNAGSDQANVTKKMHTFVTPGERAFVLLCSGSLSCSQSILTILRRQWDKGEGLFKAATMYDAARIVGAAVREVADADRAALEKDDYTFNVHIILGGQVTGERPHLFLIYPQGNPLEATEDCPYMQIGETKYGRPILDRGVRYDTTSLELACKLALLSLDSTMKSNVTVGPPIDLLAYSSDELDLRRMRRFVADDPALLKIRQRWDLALRQAVSRLPEVRFRVAAPTPGSSSSSSAEGSIELVDTPSSDQLEPQIQMTPVSPPKQ